MDLRSRVIQLLPKNSLGGVEIAVSSFVVSSYSCSFFSPIYITSPLPHHILGAPYSIIFRLWLSLNNPILYLKTLFNLLRRRPKVVISSLWRSHAVAIIYKLILPDVVLVPFVHSSKGHILDVFLTKQVIALSQNVFFDCRASREAYSGSLLNKESHIISFLLNQSSARITERQSSPRFIYWGRLADVKNVPKSVRLISGMRKFFPNSHFDIVGPDAGSLPSIMSLVDSLGMTQNTTIHGPLPYVAIKELSTICSFFIQLSSHEGMAMSVAEAMQLGLIPIVTPVGEINNYCTHMENSVIYNSNLTAIEDIVYLLSNEEKYRQVSAAACNTFMNTPTYMESFREHIDFLALKYFV
jgi:glycosyltransferase involved in cell wall biosynthesis